MANSSLRKHLNKQHPKNFTHKKSNGKDVCAEKISIKEYNSLKATEHELSSKINEKRLDSAIEKL